MFTSSHFQFFTEARDEVEDPIVASVTAALLDLHFPTPAQFVDGRFHITFMVLSQVRLIRKR